MRSPNRPGHEHLRTGWPPRRMPSTLRAILGAERLAPDERAALSALNFRCGAVLAAITMLMETYLTINNVLMSRHPRVVESVGRAWIAWHKAAYITMFLSAALLLAGYLFKRRRVAMRTDSLSSHLIIGQFVVVAMTFGILISYGDLQRGNGLYAFFIQMVSIVCIFAIRPVILIPGIALSYAIMLCLALQTDHLSHGTATNTLALGLVLIVACCVRYYTHIRDIRLSSQLERYSYHDVLTGLRNARAFRHDIQGRHGQDVTIAVMDVNDFKSCNDRFGHETGNRTLALLSASVSMELSHAERLYRVGGDEFVLLSPDMASDVTRRLTRGRRVFESNTSADGLLIGGQPLSFAFGCARGTIDGMADVVALTDQADAAMYRDKQKQGQGHGRE
ncbi:GGDEF domain-containing protein [Olsenella uli]|uniref:GGDEF domain-containing protein n=1 Tax=Olsenella uli TaxID=133926 RepID=UPI00241D3F0D|nr:GGDEF domain-containing protein [Olsenella uli]